MSGGRLDLKQGGRLDYINGGQITPNSSETEIGKYTSGFPVSNPIGASRDGDVCRYS